MKDLKEFINVCWNKNQILDLSDEGNLGFDENNIPVISDYSI